MFQSRQHLLCRECALLNYTYSYSGLVVVQPAIQINRTTLREMDDHVRYLISVLDAAANHFLCATATVRVVCASSCGIVWWCG